MPTFPAPPARSREPTLELDVVELSPDQDDPTLDGLGQPRWATDWMIAKALRDEGRIEDAIAALKRALHATRARAACRAIFGELADIYASCGERGEARYYARRAGRAVAPEPRRARDFRATAVIPYRSGP